MAIPVQLVKRQLTKRKRNVQREHRWAIRWFDPNSGKRCSESTGTADRVQAETYQKNKWAELNIPGMAPEPDPEPVEVKPLATLQECRDALERAIQADNCRSNYVSDSLMTLDCLRRMFPYTQ